MRMTNLLLQLVSRITTTQISALAPATVRRKRKLADRPAAFECLESRILLTSNVVVDSAKSVKIASGTPNGPTLADFDAFGGSVAALGDLDGNGVTDLAVGARVDGMFRGAVHVLFMNANGTVKNSVKIASQSNGGPLLVDGDVFGFSVASLGDLDGDGVTDLAVGATGDDDGETEFGTVHVLFLNANGTVKSSTQISHLFNGGPALANLDQFGFSLARLGDVNGDGVTDLAVGAIGDDTKGIDRGAVHVLFLNANGTAKSSVSLTSGVNGCPTLADGDLFGFSLVSPGDLNGDGVADLAVGAIGNDTGGDGRGAVHVLFLNSNGTVKSSTKLASGTLGGSSLANGDSFGTSAASLGDLDGDGVSDLVVGASGDDTGGDGRGAVHVLSLNANGTVKSGVKLASNTNGGPSLANGDGFGSAVASLGDLNGNGVPDLAIGAENDGTGGDGRGAVHVLFLKASQNAPADIQLNLGGPAVTWINKRPPVAVLPQVTLGGTANLTGGTLTITVNAIGTTKKALDQVHIPSFSGLGSSSGPQFANNRLTLQIQLGAGATNQTVQSFLRGMTFSTKGKGLKTPTRTAGVALVADGASSLISQTINVRKKG